MATGGYQNEFTDIGKEDDSCKDKDFTYKDPREIRLLVVGKTGAGKSATCNTIMRSSVENTDKIDKFESKMSATSVTAKSQYVKAHFRCSEILQTIPLIVVDTPGFFENRPEVSLQKFGKEIIKSGTLVLPGPHAILYVIRIGVLTQEEISTTSQIIDLFGKDVYKYIIVVFSRRHELNDQSLEDFVSTLPPYFKEFIAKCDGRIIAIENKLVDDKKVVEDLLRMVNVMKSRVCHSPHFNCEELKSADFEFSKRVGQIIVRDANCTVEKARELVREELFWEHWVFKKIHQSEFGKWVMSTCTIL